MGPREPLPMVNFYEKSARLYSVTITKYNVLSSLKTAAYNKYLDDPDDEHRLFYVGVTRAKKKLNIIYSKTERGYKI